MATVPSIAALAWDATVSVVMPTRPTSPGSRFSRISGPDCTTPDWTSASPFTLPSRSARSLAVASTPALSSPNSLTSIGLGLPERSPIRSWRTCTKSVSTPETPSPTLPRTSAMTSSIGRRLPSLSITA